MFSEAILGSSFLAESAMDTVELCPEVADITLENATDIGNIDVMDFALQSMYEFKMNMAMVDTIAVCEEYAYLKENGVEMVAETAAETIKAWFKRAKDAIITFGKRIAAFFKKILDTIDERVRGDSSWLKSHKEAINKLPSSVTLTKGIKGVKFDELYILNNYAKVYACIGDRAKSCQTYDAAKANIASMNTTTSEKANAITIGGVAAAAGLEKGITTIAQFKTALSNDVKDKKTIFSTVSNVSDMVAELEKSITERKAIKKCFEDNKKAINVALDVVKFLEKNCDKDKDPKTFEGAKVKVSMLQTCLSLLTATNRVVTQAFESRRSQYRKLINAAISASKKEAANESAIFDDELASSVY